MKKRTVKFNDYDTAAHGWTLTRIQLEDPDPKLNYIEKTLGDGSWDMTAVMTGGLVRYRDRELTLTLECSEGTRADREELLNELVNQHDGLIRDIILPDRPDHFLRGRVRISVTQSGLAYAAVKITATCEPWLYAIRENITILDDLSATRRAVTLYNNGRRAVVPVLTTSEDSTVALYYNGAHVTLPTGAYEWPTLVLTPGRHELEYAGIGALTISFREAVLR